MSLRKWSEDEEAEILTIRRRLKVMNCTMFFSNHYQLKYIMFVQQDLIAQSSGYPDVVGDRKILRYLRGHDHNLEKVIGI